MSIDDGRTVVATTPVVVDIFLHTLLLGKSRTGKSTAMLNAIVSILDAGLGCMVVDPHGPLIDTVLEYISPDRLKDVIIIDPTLPRVPGIGYFDADDKELAEQHFESNMEAKAGKNGGPRTAEIFRGTARAVLSVFKRPTIVHVHKMIVDDIFARSVFSRSKDPLVQDFYQNWYSKDVKPRDRKEAFAAPRNKIDDLMRPGIVEIMGQRKTLKWADLMDRRKIVLVRVPKGKIGANKAKSIGNVALMNAMLAGFNRKKPWFQFPIFVDECHNFFDGFDVETAIAEAGKNGQNYVFASQTTAQLRDEERHIYNDEIVIGNASSIISFRVSGKDSKRLADEFADERITKELVQLPNYTFYVWTVIDNAPTLKGPVASYLPPAKRGDELPREQVLAWATENVGTDKSIVFTEVMRQLERTPSPVNKIKKLSSRSSKLR